MPAWDLAAGPVSEPGSSSAGLGTRVHGSRPGAWGYGCHCGTCGHRSQPEGVGRQGGRVLGAALDPESMETAGHQGLLGLA